MKEENIIIPFAEMGKDEKNVGIDRRSIIMIAFLWVGTICLITIMVFQWKVADSAAKNKKNLFIDEMLLSSKDMGLGKNTSLIDLKLSANYFDEENNSQILSTPGNRKKVYNKILAQKLNAVTINAVNENSGDGFYIKPIPK